MPKTNFQLNSKQICLTYPHCDLPLPDVIDQLTKTFDSYSITYIVACSESHENGEPHRHAAIALTKTFRTRSCSAFDLRSRDGNRSFHPNVQSARRFGDWVRYVKKDGEFLEVGSYNKDSSDRLTPDQLIEHAKSMDMVQFIAFCSVHKYQMAKDIWALAHEDVSMTIDFDDVIEGVIDERFEMMAKSIVWDQNLTLLVIGEAGIGKTTWAKQTMPKPILFVSHLDDLRKFKPNKHKSILFDDVSIAHMPETAQIHLVDQENPRSIHVRYGTVRIPARTPKVFTCNTFPVNHGLNAIKRRTQLLLCFEDDLERVSKNP